ncbi:deoxyribodipyrimidine photo-lyase [Puteibacter caeruleilacunae]|nr:deoxyribodipyrimidine photo-lyase [Puteibacter caeruleilacunae]
MKQKINIFWFRRDLRLEDNHGLSKALDGPYPVLPIFIFDDNILDELEEDDARVSFIYESLKKINYTLSNFKSSLAIFKGKPAEIWKNLIATYNIRAVYTNTDYEPYAIKRDQEIHNLLTNHNIEFKSFKDQVIFEKHEVMKAPKKGQQALPYTIYTPYMKKWRATFDPSQLVEFKGNNNYLQIHVQFPDLIDFGFTQSAITVLPYNLSNLKDYEEFRDYPSRNVCSYLAPHLRFGTVSIRNIIGQLNGQFDKFLNELIWREFFMQILFHYPKVVENNFKDKYDGIEWRFQQEEWDRWCDGQTGYPLVDAGMRELNQTGYMHNRVRMVTASFLCKDLLIDWKLGEGYFASKLLDYELSSNNGNWQWAAGTGCDAAPYFRIFNPQNQLDKFDKHHEYVKKWIPEFGTSKYPKPVVDHSFARQRTLDAYKKAIDQK